MKNSFLKVFFLLTCLVFTGFSCQSASVSNKTNNSVSNTVNSAPTVNAAVTPPTNIPVASENISVSEPLLKAVVSNPIHVVGQARVFENVVSWRIKDAGGKIITSGTTEAAASDMGQFGPFDFWVVVPASLFASDVALTNKNITLEVFQASAKDGSDKDLVSVPLVLDRLDTTDLKVYFHNNKMDPEITCTTVYSVTRKIIATASPARAAMILLLQGTTSLETANHYSTVIPFRSYLKDISLSVDGVVTVDLDGVIAAPLGGSCLVSGISAEIENTLKQFSTVKEVKILIDGKADALQP